MSDLLNSCFELTQQGVETLVLYSLTTEYGKTLVLEQLQYFVRY